MPCKRGCGPGPGAPPVPQHQFYFPALEAPGPRSFSVTFCARSHLDVAPGGIEDRLSLTDRTACDGESSHQMCLETSCPL